MKTTINIYNDLVIEFSDHLEYIHCCYYDNWDSIQCCDTWNDVYFGDYLKLYFDTNHDFPLNKTKLRDLKIKYFSDKYKDAEVPNHIIADTIMQFSSNLNSCITNLCNYRFNEFQFKLKKINPRKFVLPIQIDDTGKGGFFQRTLKKIETEKDSFDWTNIQCDYKVIYMRYNNSFYINIPAYRNPTNINYERKPFIVGDPGERKFQQFYAMDHIITIGAGMRDPIMQQMHKIQSIESKLKDPNKKIKSKSRRKMRLVADRIHKKINNIVDELHYKTCIFLCRNYDRIMVTDFSSRMVSKKDGNLNKDSKKV